MRVIGQQNLCRLMRTIPPTAALFSLRYRDPLRYFDDIICRQDVFPPNPRVHANIKRSTLNLFFMFRQLLLWAFVLVRTFSWKSFAVADKKKENVVKMSNVDSSVDFSSGELFSQQNSSFILELYSRARLNFCSRFEIILRNNLHHNFPNCIGIFNFIELLNYLFKQRKSSISFRLLFRVQWFREFSTVLPPSKVSFTSTLCPYFMLRHEKLNKEIETKVHSNEAIWRQRRRA